MDISDSEIQELIELSQEEVEEATSLYQFTKEINSHFDLDQKLELMTALWQVALADDYLDKYEESIIRKISDLIHLRHSEYIQCKAMREIKSIVVSYSSKSHNLQNHQTHHLDFHL